MLNGKLTAPPYDLAVFALNTTLSCISSIPPVDMETCVRRRVNWKCVTRVIGAQQRTLQHSACIHNNLTSGVRTLVKSDTRDWSSTMNPSGGARSSVSSNQSNHGDTCCKTPQREGVKQCRMGGSPRRQMCQCSPQTPHWRALSALRPCACKPAGGGE